MTNEQEIDIGGSSIPSSNPQDPNSKPSAPINTIKASQGNLQDAAIPGESVEDLIKRVLEAPLEKLIPWEECVVPSRGFYYGWSDGVVQVKAMGQTAEKILATQRLAQSGQSLDYLFRECCRFPDGFEPADLLLGDQTFLLYYLRGITHGNEYEFMVTCPNTNCASVSTHTYNLNDLASTITWAKEELGPEPFKVVLPYTSQALGREFWVGVRFLRSRDSSDVIARRKSKKKMTARPGVRTRNAVNVHDQLAQRDVIDESISQSMEKIVVNIMGVSNVFEVRLLLSRLQAQDTAAIREWLRENTPGIDNTVILTCPDCMQEFTVELPITESFFRPTKSRRV